MKSFRKALAGILTVAVIFAGVFAFSPIGSISAETAQENVTTYVTGSDTGTGLNQFNFVNGTVTDNLTNWARNSVKFNWYNDKGANDAYMSFKFKGTKIALYAETGPGNGIAAVSIVDEAGNVVVAEEDYDFYSATADKGTKTSYVSPALDEGTYTFKLRVTGKVNPENSGNSWTINVYKVDVYSTNETTPTATPEVTPTPTPEDTIAPNAPTVSSADDNDKSIKGKTEASALVAVQNGSTVIGSGEANSAGNFSVSIPVQKAGTALKVTAKDKAGNVSEATKITIKDRTAPRVPTVNRVKANAKVVTGKAEAGARVFIRKTATGTVLASGYAKSSGSFSVAIKVQKKGTKLYISAKDKAGNVSKPAIVAVK